MAVRRVVLVVVVAAAVAVGACAAGGAPARPTPARFRVLVFTRATGYVHRSIPAAVHAIRALGRADGFAVDRTADERRFTDRVLRRYAALVFVSTTGDPIARHAHRRALRRYVERGGGFVGIHAASDSMYGWRWYVGLVGASFRHHARGTPAADVVVTDRRSAATAGLPHRWHRADEWYAFRTNPRPHVHVLATVDEGSYHPAGAAAMGADHPIAWCHRYDGGRAVYTAMGHTSASYAEPPFRAHLLGAIRMAAGRAPFRC